jgi:histone deacetylase 1/2
LSAFFRHIEISHHVSCPYHNGSAECKHHHIIEVGLSLLCSCLYAPSFGMNLSSPLINRLPRKVIYGHTPLERLFHQAPDYLILLTFGCSCWSNLCPYDSRKLQFCSKQCVFLGYSNMHKWFKCLHVSKGRIYISRDVVFDKNVYPLLNSTPMPEPISNMKFCSARPSSSRYNYTFTTLTVRCRYNGANNTDQLILA